MRYLSLFRILPALLLALLLTPVSASAAPESVPLKTGWLGEYEAFPVWYAREQGLGQGKPVWMWRCSASIRARLLSKA